MLGALKTGDRVVTSGGIRGVIISFRDNVVLLQIAKDVKVELERSAITGLLNGETAAEAKK